MKKITNWLKKYFIPHEGNEHIPHFLRHESMTVVFLIVVVIELGFMAQVFIVFDKTKFLAAVLPGVLTTLANEERTQNNLQPVSENSLLNKAAELKAQDMATRGYFAHTSPEGLTPWYWLDQVGYKYLAAGENLAVNFYESSDVDRAWMNSPTHRANMLKAGYTEIGIGVASGVYQGRNSVFVAQFFGTPIKITPAEIKPTPAPLPKNTPVKPITPTQPTTIVTTLTPAQPPIQVLGEEKISPAPTVAEKTVKQSKVRSFVERILTSPLQFINYTYAGIALVIVVALLLAIFIKSEIQHPAIIARGVALIAVIILLFIVNVKILRPDVMVPTSNLEAATIVAY